MMVLARARPRTSVGTRGSRLRWTVPWEVAALVFPLATVGSAAAGFLVGVPVGRWQAVCGLVTSLLACLAGAGAAGHRRRKVVLVGGLVAASVAVASVSVMYSNPDAEAYHRPASILMATGWNPVFDGTVEAVEALRRSSGSLRVWHVAYLPRAYWIFGAALYRTLGFVEAADAFGVLAAVLSFCMVSRLISRLVGLRGWPRRIVAAMLTLSPAVVSLTFGGSSDGCSYSLFLIAVSAATLYLTTGRRQWLWHVVAAFPLMASLKFTGVVCCAVVSLVFLAGCLLAWWRGRAGPELAARWSQAVVIASCLAAVIGFSPYVTNWARYGGPFYPAHTFDRRVPTSQRITEDFLRMNDDARRMGYIGRFSYAYVSQRLTLAAYGRGAEGGAFSPRFDVSGGVGGFGGVFRAAFMLSLLILPFARVGWLGYPLACVLISVLLQPTMSMGYARYAPQFYAFPPLAFLAAARRWTAAVATPEASPAARRAASWIMPATVWGTASCYALPQLVYPLSFLALQWIISVQNLEIVKAMRRDPRPMVVSKTFYARHTLDHDYGCRDIRHFAAESELPPEAAGRHAYTPYFSFYSYYAPTSLEGFPVLQHVVSNNDPAVAGSRNRRNMEFFLLTFLPREVPRIPRYLFDVVLLRCRQLGTAWRGAKSAGAADEE